MKLSSIDSTHTKSGETQVKKAKRDIRDILAAEGLGTDVLVDTAMKLHVPHPGVETREKAREVFIRELDHALSDPNLCLLLYAGVLLEREAMSGELPNLPADSYKKDLTYLIIDEVIGMAIAKYISGDKGIFEFVRFDKLKPGVLSKLGPFMDDVVAGLIGGVSANMYSRSNREDTKVKPDIPSGGVAG